MGYQNKYELTLEESESRQEKRRTKWGLTIFWVIVVVIALCLFFWYIQTQQKCPQAVDPSESLILSSIAPTDAISTSTVSTTTTSSTSTTTTSSHTSSTSTTTSSNYSAEDDPTATDDNYEYNPDEPTKD